VNNLRHHYGSTFDIHTNLIADPEGNKVRSLQKCPCIKIIIKGWPCIRVGFQNAKFCHARYIAVSPTVDPLLLEALRIYRSARRAPPSTRLQKSHSLRSRRATDVRTRASPSAASWVGNRRMLAGVTSTTRIGIQTSWTCRLNCQ
jgi:hypothetical protein